MRLCGVRGTSRELNDLMHSISGLQRILKGFLFP